MTQGYVILAGMRRVPLTVFVPLVILLISAFPGVSQNAQVPPISWTCPMHPDVIEDHKGNCPICRMALVPVRIGYTWSCPVHSVIDEDRAGKCRICGRDLAQMTIAVTYACAGRPKTERLNPGKCADGSAAIPKHRLRAHGNHSPQHGGLFFMASDNWHHLEGVHPEPGVFRLYLYDDYSKTLPAAQMRQVTGTVAGKNVVIPLKLSADGKTLEAKIDGLAPPAADLVAKVKFRKDGPEYRFDFIFPSFSKDVAPSPAPVTISSDLPEKTGELVSQLAARNKEIEGLIQRGAFGEIYVAAFQAKDLALALDARSQELPLAKRAALTAAVERVVRSAWQLDAAGDLGDGDLIAKTYQAFTQAAGEVIAAFPAVRQK